LKKNQGSGYLKGMRNSESPRPRSQKGTRTAGRGGFLGRDQRRFERYLGRKVRAERRGGRGDSVKKKKEELAIISQGGPQNRYLGRKGKISSRPA